MKKMFLICSFSVCISSASQQKLSSLLRRAICTKNSIASPDLAANRWAGYRQIVAENEAAYLKKNPVPKTVGKNRVFLIACIIACGGYQLNRAYIDRSL